MTENLHTVCNVALICAVLDGSIHALPEANWMSSHWHIYMAVYR